jgi:tetratricopeptide (TPR) repeat protein
VLQIAPAVPEHTHDLLVTANRLGDAQAALGDSSAAVLSFEKMVEAGSALLDVDAYNIGWANDLALALERLGTAKASAEDIEGALKSYREGLALRDWLWQQDTGNAVWYRNLALGYANVSGMLAKTGEMEAALDHQDTSVTILRDLVAAYPGDPWYKIDLVQALDYKAVLLTDPGPTNQEALSILEAMYAEGTLPAEYVEWIPAFRKVLGLPTEF